MRMHTIPQNVTAYEDKIVGMLVGRQFIYLAIGGVIIFILLSTNIGPIVIRVFLSMVVGVLAAALALYKPNDRSFDALLLSYVRAIFGPTEWVWRKDVAPIEKLHLITDQLAGRPPVVQKGSAQKGASGDRDNLLRVSRYQTFIADKESGVDHEELEFIEQLNFSEPIPQKAFDTVNADEKAPPMLTKKNYAQIKSTMSAPTTPPMPKVTLPKPKPLTEIAGSSQPLGATIAVEGRQQGVQLRSNLRTNRSLSRQLLTSGLITLPVRGERTLDLSDELKDELKDIVSYMQASGGSPAPSPTQLVSGESKTKTVAPVASPPPPAPTPKPKVEPQPQQSRERISRFSDYDWSSTPSVSQQISMLSKALPNSGITKGITMSDTSTTNESGSLQSTPQSQPQSQPQPQPSQVKVMPSIQQQQPMASDTELEREAQHIEAETQKALSELEKTNQGATTAEPAAVAPTPTSESNPKLAYDAEIQRLKALSEEMEQKARQAEDSLRQLQQQMASQQIPNHPAVGAQQELVDSIRQQQAASDATRQNLESKLSSSIDADHLHAEYSPLPQVAPVISEEVVEALPAELSASAPAPAPTPATVPEPQVAAPAEEGGELDFQAKMAAAGVATAEPVAAIPTPVAAETSANPASPQKVVALTNQPNIINGVVLDAQGQLVPGVIVVVKNAQGESKRALKTNKLGQFVVTTPLSNGAYSVEVDKKGLSFDIMKVELSGLVLEPILIKAKTG